MTDRLQVKILQALGLPVENNIETVITLTHDSVSAICTMLPKENDGLDYLVGNCIAVEDCHYQIKLKNNA